MVMLCYCWKRISLERVFVCAGVVILDAALSSQSVSAATVVSDTAVMRVERVIGASNSAQQAGDTKPQRQARQNIVNASELIADGSSAPW